MKEVKEALDYIGENVRAYMRWIAKWISRVTGGKVTPNAITIFGLFIHVPISISIARGRFGLAALLLVVFGLLDMLGGELARAQKHSSMRGMLLKASTDRIKEIMLYSGAGFYLAGAADPRTVTWAVIACGASLMASYVKAKGEAVITSSKNIIPHHILNGLFADGMLTFTIRMFVLILGLLTGQLLVAVAGIAILASLTALQRLVTISEKLES